MVQLAKDADVLIHEATGFGAGHSSASQAGSIAREAKAKRLILIHYPIENLQTESLVEQAKSTFSNDIGLAEDFMQIPF